MRRLTLKKETVGELTTSELAGVVGASFPSKYDCTESYQVCNPLSREVCIQRPDISRLACIPTQGC